MTGGYFLQDDVNVIYLDSSEIMADEQRGWELLQEHPLPHPIKDLRGISIQNKIFMTDKNVLHLSTQILPRKDFTFLIIHKFRQSCIKP